MLSHGPNILQRNLLQLHDTFGQGPGFRKVHDLPRRPQQTKGDPKSHSWPEPTSTGIKGHVVLRRDYLSWFIEWFILVYRDLSLKIPQLASSLFQKSIFWNSKWKLGVCWKLTALSNHRPHFAVSRRPSAWQVMRFKESRHSTMALLVRSKIPTSVTKSAG